MVIDVHAHYTTAPSALGAWRDWQIAVLNDPSKAAKARDLNISDDEIRESIEINQLRLMQARGVDLTVFSPPAAFMSQPIGDWQTASRWAAICNSLCYRVSQLFPGHFMPAAMLPQAPGHSPRSCIAELVKCVEQLGNVAINLNPDPSGGDWTAPVLPDKSWYPIYEKMVEYDIPAMIHVSTSCHASLPASHRLNTEVRLLMQCLGSDLFKDFPSLKFLFPHGGGALPYQWPRFRGALQETSRPMLAEQLQHNLFFDTCIYHQQGMNLLSEVIPTQNLLFASEMMGAVRGKDPRTGHDYDDTKRYIEASPNFSAQAKRMVFEGNARRVFTRLDAALKAKGR